MHTRIHINPQTIPVPIQEIEKTETYKDAHNYINIIENTVYVQIFEGRKFRGFRGIHEYFVLENSG